MSIRWGLSAITGYQTEALYHFRIRVKGTGYRFRYRMCWYKGMTLDGSMSTSTCYTIPEMFLTPYTFILYHLHLTFYPYPYPYLILHVIEYFAFYSRTKNG